jgi:hypothetical protein
LEAEAYPALIGRVGGGKLQVINDQGERLQMIIRSQEMDFLLQMAQHAGPGCRAGSISWLQGHGKLWYALLEHFSR